MSPAQPIERDVVNRSLDVFIYVGLVALLAGVCFQILRPFLLIIAWGVIVAIAIYPAFGKLKTLLGGRAGLSAVVVTVILVAAVIVPSVLLTGTLVEGIHNVAAHLKDGTLAIPAPPPGIKNWPVVGTAISDAWSLASTNLTAALRNFAPQIKAAIPGVLTASAAVGLTLIQLILSILIAGVLLAHAQQGARLADSLAGRLFGSRASEFEVLAGSTIRSVTTGIVGVALIQSVFAGIGFLIFGLPAAGLWAAVFLVGAVLQVGAALLIPAVVYMFATASTTKAILFLIWCAFVGLMDNVLKPLLLGRGVDVPIAVVFLGAIGGFISMGIIGLFIGAIVLSVGYKLVLAWLGIAPATSEV